MHNYILEIKWGVLFCLTFVTCNLCSVLRGLKKIITPLFAGLMEVDPQRMWNFDRFFQEVTAIVIILLMLRAYQNTLLINIYDISRVPGSLSISSTLTAFNHSVFIFLLQIGKRILIRLRIMFWNCVLLCNICSIISFIQFRSY